MTENQRPKPLPAGIDHLIYFCGRLETGMDRMEDLLGVRPAPGGRHADYGTHNALLSLGADSYLEIMAPDPAAPRDGPVPPFELPEGCSGRLATWVLRAETIEETAATARAAGVALGELQSGSRERPDGKRLFWRLTDPYAKPMGGAIPFLIAWGDTPHPASVAPAAGELASLRVEHPEPARVTAALALLGVDLPVSKAAAFRMRAAVRQGGRMIEIGSDRG